ncbi:SDR family oxidoreductase [Rhodococcus sp. NPDC060086]|uniref:SDR family oxidoreductase n=1 Tax=Rhodococcus sp. NPDC060086 TaxID=3347055 RepID=UPI0036637666
MAVVTGVAVTAVSVVRSPVSSWRQAHVFVTHFRDHDLDQPWGADDLDAVVSETGRPTRSDTWTSWCATTPTAAATAHCSNSTPQRWTSTGRWTHGRSYFSLPHSPVADELLERKILLNAVNPGPANTGYLSPDTRDRDEETLRAVLEAFPQKRFGQPDDPARLIAWLVSDEGRWVVGQVIDSEGGLRRSRW